MELIGTIIAHIFMGIFKFFKFVWTKWRLAGVLAIFFIIELMILVPLYESSVNERARITVRNYDIVGVEQSDLPRDKGKIFITIENKSSDKIGWLSSVELEISGVKYYMLSESNYKSLENQGYNFSSGSIIPPATRAKVVYSFEDDIIEQGLPNGLAKLTIGDYYNDEKKQFEFELKPATELPEVSGE